MIPIFLAVLLRAVISANWHHYIALRKRNRAACITGEAALVLFVAAPVAMVLIVAAIDGASPTYSIAMAEWMQRHQ